MARTQIIPTYKGPLHIFTYKYIFQAPASNTICILITFYNKQCEKEERIFEIYSSLCNQCLSPLMLWVRILDTTLCDKVCQWLTAGQFSPCTFVSSANKIDRHDITEIFLKVTLNTISIYWSHYQRLCTFIRLYYALVRFYFYVNLQEYNFWMKLFLLHIMLRITPHIFLNLAMSFLLPC